MFRFTPQLLSEIFLFLRTVWDVTKNVYWSSCKVPVILSDFNDTWIFLITFENYWNIKFHENLSSWSRLVPCGQMEVRMDTDRHDRANSYFSLQMRLKNELLGPYLSYKSNWNNCQHWHRQSVCEDTTQFCLLNREN